MSLTFGVMNSNEFFTASHKANSKAMLAVARRRDTIRLIWTKCIFPRIFGPDFLKTVIEGEAHTCIFSVEVPPSLDNTIDWKEFRHIAMYQNFSTLCGNSVRTTPWQVRIEFCHKVRPYLELNDATLDEFAKYLRVYNWEFVVTPEGFILMPLPVYTEFREMSETFKRWQEACTTVRGPGYTDMAWGDDDFKTFMQEADEDFLHFKLTGETKPNSGFFAVPPLNVSPPAPPAPPALPAGSSNAASASPS